MDMLLMFEKGKHGGMSMINHRYARANIPNSPDYRENEAPRRNMYWHANNFHV